MTRQRFYHRAWLWLLAAVAALEIVTLFRRRPDETLSAYVRNKTRGSVLLRGALGGLLGWLGYHWLTDTGVSWIDLAAATIGVMAGVFTPRRAT